MKYRHFSFDLDGTIIDTLDVMERAWNETAQHFKLWHDFSEYKREIGLPFGQIMRNLGVADEELEVERYYFEQTERLVSEATLFPSVLDFMEKIKATGATTSIITSKPRRNSESILTRHDVTTDFLMCGDDPVGAKPTELPMKTVREQLGLGEGDPIIYFGDMVNDLVFSVNSEVDYCHCNFGIGGRLSDYLIPVSRSIDSWDDTWLDGLL